MTVVCEEEKNVIVLKRSSLEKEIICIYNFSDQAQTVATGVISGLQILLNSADLQWGGRGWESGPIKNGMVAIEPESAIVLLHSVR